jgi:tetratricopeptide (TPR) repeat protein
MSTHTGIIPADHTASSELTAAIEHLGGKLARDPKQEDVLLELASCYRRANWHDAALRLLADFIATSPARALAHRELGYLHLETGAVADAVAAFEKATSLNPALLECWRELSSLHCARGEALLAERAAQRADVLARLPATLLAVTIDLHDGKLQRAEQACREYMRKNPRDTEGMRLLAAIGLELGVLDDAEFLLASCLMFNPSYVAARYDYARVLHKRHKFAQARAQAQLLLKIDPQNLAYKSAFAAESLAIGDFDAALRVYDEVIAADPADPNPFLYRGHALKTVGRTADAIKSYRKAGTLKPDFGDAFWSLANLKTYQFADDEIEQMLSHEANPATSDVDRYHLCFALGKAFEQRGEFARSFGFYVSGNRLKKSELRYRPERVLKEMELQRDVFTPDFLRSRAGQGYTAADPIFIVGMPRAGSTLIEQVLASHPMVDGTMELPDILSITHRLNGRQTIHETPKYPGILRELSPQAIEALGQEYTRGTQVYRKYAPRFTDKMPNNFRHAGLISLILPGARIIDARRGPMACCLSAFTQLFAEGQEYSYDLTDLGRYFRAYVELMDHWARVLPDKVLRVNYEDVVADLEIQVRRILEFCGLPFDERCLNFHETERAVRTASSEQVRQRLYRSGVEHWKNFEPYLEPLRSALGDLAPGSAT